MIFEVSSKTIRLQHMSSSSGTEIGWALSGVTNMKNIVSVKSSFAPSKRLNVFLAMFCETGPWLVVMIW